MIVPGNEHPLRPGDRINICDVEFIYYLAPPRETLKPRETERRDGRHRGGRPTILEHADPRRLALQHPGQRRAARGQAQGDPRDHPQPLERAADRRRRAQDPRLAGRAVPPGRAALPGPPGPGHQAAGPQGIQVPAQPPDPVPRHGRRPRGRDPDEHQPVDRQPRARPEEGGAQPGRRQRPEPADQRVDRRPEDPLGDVRPAADPRRPGAGHPPARHQRPEAVPPGRPRRAGGGGQPGGDRDPERARCTSRCWSASGWSTT